MIGDTCDSAIRFDDSKFDPRNSALIVAFLSTQQWQKSMAKRIKIFGYMSWLPMRFFTCRDPFHLEFLFLEECKAV